MDPFYASWTDAIRSRAKKLERSKSFIQFCKRRNWLTEDTAEDLDAPHGASVTMPKAPFSDEELATDLCCLRQNWRANEARTRLRDMEWRGRWFVDQWQHRAQDEAAAIPVTPTVVQNPSLTLVWIGVMREDVVALFILIGAGHGMQIEFGHCVQQLGAEIPEVDSIAPDAVD
jgi:hypothetical protein